MRSSDDEEMIKKLLSEIYDMQCSVCEVESILENVEQRLESITATVRTAKKVKHGIDDTMTLFIKMLSKILLKDI